MLLILIPVTTSEVVIAPVNDFEKITHQEMLGIILLATSLGITILVKTHVECD